MGFPAEQAPWVTRDGPGRGVWKDRPDPLVPKVSEEPKVTQELQVSASEARWAPPESQVNLGCPAMPKTGSLGAPALRGRPDPLDTPALRARLAPPASATPPSAPTSPASPPARGM